MIPENAKHFGGARAFLLQGIRGEHNNTLGLLWYFQTESDRNKYFNEDGSPTDQFSKTLEKLQPIEDELAKLGTWISQYTDWIVP